MKELIEALRDLMSHSHNGFPQEKKDVINDFIARMDAFPDSSNPCKDYSDFENRNWDKIDDDKYENCFFQEETPMTIEWSKYCSNFIKAVTGAD
tara:strand:+ start:1659 stop:1940 length:282 start_codon:yes stop_codon:yes gene_type:complete